MKPNFLIVYVSDPLKSATWYSDFFEMEPVLSSPGFVAYKLDGDITLGLWIDSQGVLASNPARTTELGLEVDGGTEGVQAMWEKLSPKAATIVEEVHDLGFGATFLLTDPDGNYIRVVPKMG